MIHEENKQSLQTQVKITNKETKKKLMKIFLTKPWKNYIKNLEFSREKKKSLSKEIDAKKKEIIAANQNLERSKLSFFFFRPWIKDRVVSLTLRQRHLNKLYKEYENNLFSKERKDFLKTYFGEILKTAYLHSSDWKGLWVSARTIAHNYQPTKKNIYNLKQKTKTKKKLFSPKKIPWLFNKPQRKEYQLLKTSLQKGWLYETLLKKKQSANAIYFELDRPHTAFQNYFKQQSKEPWLDPLLFKRWAYFGLIERGRKEIKTRVPRLKDYLRKRNPRYEKRNKLYWWRRKLLFNFKGRNWIKKKRAARIKQVIKKTYLPFYGNFTGKQLRAILKKKKKKKSKLLNKTEEILSSFENRLDIVVYRLNLAPNVLWARRLIQEGSIFVSSVFSFQNWVRMYSQIKHFLFPLKLRDPKNLYKTKPWNPNRKISKFKFFLKPTKKIHYLVKPGDFIQSAKTLALNIVKSNTRLFRKPIKKNLFSISKIKKYAWNNASKAPRAYSAYKWQTPAKQINASLFLFDTRFTDLGLKTNDRARELFFRWVTI